MNLTLKEYAGDTKLPFMQTRAQMIQRQVNLEAELLIADRVTPLPKFVSIPKVELNTGIYTLLKEIIP